MAKTKIIGDVSIKVRPDTTGFKNELLDDLRRIEREIGQREIEYVPDLNRAAVQRLKAKVEKLKQQLSGKNINFDPKLDRTSAAKVSGQLALLARDRHIEFEIGLDKSSVANMLGTLALLSGGRVYLDNLRYGFDQLKNLDRISVQVAKMGTAVVMLSAALIALTGHLFTIGSGLLSMFNILIAGPGILGGMVVGIGTMVAALVDFGTVLPDVVQKFKDLQDSLSSNFWAVAAEPIREFVNSIWPAFSAGVNETATALGGFFAALATSFDGFDLTPMFDGLISSIQIFSGYTDNIVGIIETLGLTGAKYLPQFATWFGDITAQFDAFLAAAAADGRLDMWIENAKTNLAAFGSSLSSIWTIFGGISDAAQAAGSTGLVGLAAGLERIDKVVNSDGFQTGLTTLFKAAFDTVDAFMATAGPGLVDFFASLPDLLGRVGPMLGSALGQLVGSLGAALSNPLVQDNIATMFAGITTAIQTLTPVVGPVVGMISALGPVIGAIAANIGLLLAAGLDRMAPTFTAIADALVPVIDKLGPVLAGILEALVPLWDKVGEQVLRIIDAAGPLIDAFQRLCDLLLPILVPVLGIIAGLIGDTIVMAIHGVTDIIEGLVNVIEGVKTVVQNFGSDWGAVWEGVKQIFGGVFEAIWGIVQTVFAVGVLGAVRKGWTAIKGLFTNFSGNLKTISSELWTSIKDRASLLWEGIKNVPMKAMQFIVNFIKGVAGDLRAAAELAFGKFATAAFKIFDDVIAFVKTIPGKIKNGLGGLGDLLYNSGKALIQGLINGIRAMLGAVGDAASAIASKIKSFFPGSPVKDGPLRSWNGGGAGRRLIEGLVAGMESQYASVKSSVEGLANDIAGTLDASSQYRIGIATAYENADPSALGGLTRAVAVSTATTGAGAGASQVVNNITIPLEDLAQLKSLEDFLDMLRVRTRQGVVA